MSEETQQPNVDHYKMIEEAPMSVMTPMHGPIDTSIRQQIDEYFGQGGDAKRYDYPELTPDSIVFDVGAFEGEFAQRIHDKYGSFVYMFEIAPEFIDTLNKRYGDHEKIWIFQHGLGHEAGSFSLRRAANATTIHAQEEDGEAEIKKLSEFMESEMDGKDVDLIKINIEGPEYDLVDHILDSGLIKRFKNLQVQFHNFVPDAGKRLLAIRKRLKETHDMTWSFDFVFENWKLRE